MRKNLSMEVLAGIFGAAPSGSELLIHEANGVDCLRRILFGIGWNSSEFVFPCGFLSIASITYAIVQVVWFDICNKSH